MAENISLFVAVLTIYAGLLAVQKIRQKSSWRGLVKNGDPWFVINLPISVIVAIPVSRSITKFLT